MQMLHILWMILKIAGIVILVLFALILLILLTVLLAPLRYRVDGRCDGTFDSLEADIRFSWLFHLIAGQFTYKENAVKWRMRIAWKKTDSGRGEQKEHAAYREAETESGERSVKRTEEAKKPQETDNSPRKKTEQTETKRSASSKIQKKQSKKTNGQRKRKETQKKERRKGIFEKIAYTFRTICDKIKILKEKKEKIVEFLNDEIHRTAFSSAVKEIRRLFCFLKPKKIQGRVHFGFEDPSLTGKTLAAAAVCYPFYGDMLTIEPDFEKQVLEGELHVSGHVRGVYAVIIAWNLIVNKEIRATYSHIRKFQL